MKRDPCLYVKDIIDAIGKIEEFTLSVNYKQFARDDKTANAVIRKLEIIGEAVKQIPKEITQKYLEVPWQDMARMRDKLIHFYFGIDYEVIWNVIEERLPIIKSQLKKIMRQIKES